MKQIFTDIFIYAGVSKEEYMAVKEEVRKRNADILLYSTIVVGALLAVLYALSFKIDTIQGNQVLYGGILISINFLLLLEIMLNRWGGWLIMLNCYIFSFLVYVFAITMGTVLQPDNPATAFCVFLFAVPLMFTDHPYCFNLLLIMVTVVFCSVSFYIKDIQLAKLDAVNAVSFLILGVVINTYLQRIKIKEFVQKKQIEDQRDTDELTKLMMRPATEEAIQRYLKRTKEPAILLVIDLDEFKTINDTWGHAYGDVILRLMGVCLKEVFGNGGICGRYGGDEFLVFLPHTQDREQVLHKVGELMSVMKIRLKVPDQSWIVHASAGAACYPKDERTYQGLFKKADEALYVSKTHGKSCCTFYSGIESKKV